MLICFFGPQRRQVLISDTPWAVINSSPPKNAHSHSRFLPLDSYCLSCILLSPPAACSISSLIHTRYCEVLLLLGTCYLLLLGCSCSLFPAPAFLAFCFSSPVETAATIQHPGHFHTPSWFPSPPYSRLILSFSPRKQQLARSCFFTHSYFQPQFRF